MVDLSIIIPCFNEEKNIRLLLVRLDEAIKNQSKEIEIILVDNGSTDDTRRELTKLILLYPFANAIYLEKNQGYGGGILAGLEVAKGKVLGWTHADLQTDVTDIFLAHRLMMCEEQTELLIKGRRYQRNLIEELLTLGMTWIAFLILRVKMVDINGQPKLFTRSVYEKILADGSPKDFSLDMYLMYVAQQNNVRLLEVPVLFHKRLHGVAKGGAGDARARCRVIWRSISYIFSLSKKSKPDGSSSL